MNQTINACIRCLTVCLFLFSVTGNIQALRNDAFDRKVQLSRSKGTVYEFLRDISDQSGYLFIYDSQVINNDRKIKIPKGKYMLRDAIYLITGNERLQIDLIDEYILLRMPEMGIKTEASKGQKINPETADLRIKGKLFDQDTGNPVLFASISILNGSIGTVTNQEGEFQLTVPDSLRFSKIRCSHIGYESREVDLSLLEGNHIDLAMKPQVIPLQEIVIRAVSPMQVLSDMLNHRTVNYTSDPVYLTSFYREGIEYRRRNIDLTESVLQVYKTGYKNRAVEDQVKLIKKRRITDRQAADTIFPKMRSGINSCLVLDIIKELPEFMDPVEGTSYMYAHTGMNVIDGRLVDVIFFQQKDYVKEPMYKGEFFIEVESKALVEVRFEINPELVRKATNMFIDKKSAGLQMDLQQARYIVSYKPVEDGFYCISHVRGDIEFKIRRKKRLFSAPLHFWFEMVTCKVDAGHAKPFARNERLSPTRIFAETRHEYDKTFWDHFNIILPEEKLKDAIIQNLSEVVITE
ncbi:MAG: carboxypeptidase-like regulatory domain-containing protein [Tannerella sp.]|jgi:hypothetical protein|nr:carboxypeptidase-like regulatory domain-containing protein [Tannerella sp.]